MVKKLNEKGNLRVRAKKAKSIIYKNYIKIIVFFNVKFIKQAYDIVVDVDLAKRMRSKIQELE